MYALTEDQLAVQDLVRRVAREQVAPRADAIDRNAEYPQDMFDLLKDLGLFALPLPTEHGGTGSLLAGCIAVEEFGRVCYNTGYLLVVQWVAFGALHAAGNAEQKSRFLPGLATGELRGAFSTTEAQSGSDVSGIKTRATRVDGGYRLNGSKIWCTNSDVADFVLVGAKCAGPDGKDSINLFIVEKGTKGFSVGRKEEKMGARGVPSCPLFFDDAVHPRSEPDGARGRCRASSRSWKHSTRAARSSPPVPSASRKAPSTTPARSSSSARRSGGASPTSRACAGCWPTWPCRPRPPANSRTRPRRWSTPASPARNSAAMAAMAKCFASDVAMKVATDAVQMFGAAGISNEYPINRYFRDAKVVQIIEGTNQIQRNIIANMLLGREQKA